MQLKHWIKQAVNFFFLFFGEAALQMSQMNFDTEQLNNLMIHCVKILRNQLSLKHWNCYRWGFQGWWCTGLGGCSGSGPHPGRAAARWCPDSSISPHWGNSWSALRQVQPEQPSTADTGVWRSWRLYGSHPHHTQAASAWSKCVGWGGEKKKLYSFTNIQVIAVRNQFFFIIN